MKERDTLIERRAYIEIAGGLSGSSIVLFFIVGIYAEANDLPLVPWVGPIVAWSFAWAVFLWIVAVRTR